MQLSQHFALSEMNVSQYAARHGIVMTPPPEVIACLRALCINILDPLRMHLGEPIHVLSGYRSPEVNAAVGGARNSQHMVGQAADIVAAGVAPRDLGKIILAMPELKFDQLIIEFDQWVHISFNPFGEQRHSILTARKVGGVTKYLSGLV